MILKRCAACLALLCLLILPSCGRTAGWDEAGNLYIKQSGVSYDMAPYSYEPVLTDRRYATMKVGDITLTLYEVEGVDPARMLGDEFNTLYYATTVELPTLSTMQVDRLDCYNEGSVGAARSTLTDRGRLDAVVKAHDTGARLPEDEVRRLSLSTLKHATLNFYSAEYPGFCYALTYLEYGQSVTVGGTDHGTAFFYDRYEGVFIAAGDALAGILS